MALHRRDPQDRLPPPSQSTPLLFPVTQVSRLYLPLRNCNHSRARCSTRARCTLMRFRNYVTNIGNMDNTLSGKSSEWQPSTSGMLFFAQRRLSGLQADVHPCLDASQYLSEKLRAAGQCQSKRASTVCLECPVDQGFIQRWRA